MRTFMKKNERFQNLTHDTLTRVHDLQKGRRKLKFRVNSP